MPTSLAVTPLRILPSILAIPLLLLVFPPMLAGGPAVSDALSPCDGPCRLAHRLPVPIPWEDDTLTAGLPPPPSIGKRTLRKWVPVRLPIVGKPRPVRSAFPSGFRLFSSFPIDDLVKTLCLSRPPPAGLPHNGDGGRKGDVSFINTMT